MKARTPGTSVTVDILEFNKGRKPKLLKLKLKRMSADSFAFFRGTCHRFASAWERPLEPADAGPSLLVCGDLHLENFGAYRDPAGEFLYDINDFDESTIAPCSVDVVRCATSILLAAENWGLSPLQANGMVLDYLNEYRAVIDSPLLIQTIDASAPRLSRGPIWEILDKTALGDQQELLDANTERLKNGTRRILRNRFGHPELKEDRAAEIKAAVAEYAVAKGDCEFYQPLDVTRRVAGIGSLGLERYLVLVAGGGSAETNELYDIKQVQSSVWSIRFLAQNGGAPFKSEAARVVAAQTTLQAHPAAGLDTIKVGDEFFRIRQMIPLENRSRLDRFQKKPSKLRIAITAAGRLTGLSHLRGAKISAERDETEALRNWVNGPALDSVLASAARFAEQTRVDYKCFRAEMRAPEALPEKLLTAIGR